MVRRGKKASKTHPRYTEWRKGRRVISREGAAKTTGAPFGMRSPIWDAEPLTSISRRLRVPRPQKGDEQHHLLPSACICPIDSSAAIP